MTCRAFTRLRVRSSSLTSLWPPLGCRGTITYGMGRPITGMRTIARQPEPRSMSQCRESGGAEVSHDLAAPECQGSPLRAENKIHVFLIELAVEGNAAVADEAMEYSQQRKGLSVDARQVISAMTMARAVHLLTCACRGINQITYHLPGTSFNRTCHSSRLVRRTATSNSSL